MAAARVFSTAKELQRVNALACPYGSGDTAGRVVNALNQPELLEILSPVEPGVAVPAAVHAAGWDVWAESA
jgi:hypothetical protein